MAGQPAGNIGNDGPSIGTIPTFNVQDYGAFPNGTDATPGFRSAIGAAQAVTGGATVYVPRGTYSFTSKVAGEYAASIQIHELGAPITLSGDGPGSSILQETVAAQALVSVHTDGTVVEGLTLDCQAYQGGTCFGVGSVGLDDSGNAIGGNQVTLQHCTALGSAHNKRFTLYFAGPPGAAQSHQYFQLGNTVRDCTVHDQINDDGFSFAFQRGGTISRITHFGSRLAIFECQDLLVEDYDYTPNPECNTGAVQGIVTNGFWITPPSKGITIKRFTSSGQGGIITGPYQERIVEDVTIVDQTFTQPGFGLEIGNVHGLRIRGGSYSGATLIFEPAPPGPKSNVPANEGLPAGVTEASVTDTVISQVRVQGGGVGEGTDGPLPPPKIDVTFERCTFDTTPVIGEALEPTFASVRPGDKAFTKDTHANGPARFSLQTCAVGERPGGFMAGGELAKVRACSVSGTVVTLELATEDPFLVAGRPVTVAGLTGFDADEPNGTFVVQTLEPAPHTHATVITYDSTPAPVVAPGGVQVDSAVVVPQPGVFATVQGCSTSPVRAAGGAVSTLVTLVLAGRVPMTPTEWAVVEGIAGWVAGGVTGAVSGGATPGPGGGSGLPLVNGRWQLERVSYTARSGSRAATTEIVYRVPHPVHGAYAGGGVVLALPLTFEVAGTAPINLVPPVVTGSPSPGATLTASVGRWLHDEPDGRRRFAFQWVDGHGLIAGATGASLVLPRGSAGRRVGVVVTATNSAGSTATPSQPVEVTRR